jgi:hypothetical protein
MNYQRRREDEVSAKSIGKSDGQEERKGKMDLST